MAGASGGQTASPGSEMAQATLMRLRRVRRAASSRPSGIMGPRDAEPAQQCHRSFLSKYATPLPQGLLRRGLQ